MLSGAHCKEYRFNVGPLLIVLLAARCRPTAYQSSCSLTTNEVCSQASNAHRHGARAGNFDPRDAFRSMYGGGDMYDFGTDPTRSRSGENAEEYRAVEFRLAPTIGRWQEEAKMLLKEAGYGKDFLLDLDKKIDFGVGKQPAYMYP